MENERKGGCLGLIALLVCIVFFAPKTCGQSDQGSPTASPDDSARAFTLDQIQSCIHQREHDGWPKANIDEAETAEMTMTIAEARRTNYHPPCMTAKVPFNLRDYDRYH